MEITTPISVEQIQQLRVYDKILINGTIFAGRDAVLPKLVRLIEDNKLDTTGIDLQGAVIFHTAVSPAGIGPTSSNKVEIESSIPLLSKAGVKIHLGKGSLDQKTVEALRQAGSIFAVTPPVTALFSAKLKSQRVAAFPQEGMEAFYALEVEDFPAIVAIAHGVSIYNK
ncbi:MAG TPA: fumarate hydratase C-terminal domain-containing protein [Clostridia bacterium]|nr:fumarate hydratase C-terminal domain-containing protein [Clostridia bacterium]